MSASKTAITCTVDPTELEADIQRIAALNTRLAVALHGVLDPWPTPLLPAAGPEAEGSALEPPDPMTLMRSIQPNPRSSPPPSSWCAHSCQSSFALEEDSTSCEGGSDR